jgi:hypothetical protein
MTNIRSFCFIIAFHHFVNWKTGLLVNAQVLAGCHFNEEEIRWHLKKIYKILAGPNEWQQVCNWSNPEKTGRSCEGAVFSWMSSKVSRTLTQGVGMDPSYDWEVS